MMLLNTEIVQYHQLILFSKTEDIDHKAVPGMLPGIANLLLYERYNYLISPL